MHACQRGRMIYKGLKVWQKADELAIEVYKITREFPKDEIYGITSPLRRAALSVPTNFVNIAIGSMAETEYLLDFSKRIGYLNDEDYRRSVL